MVDLPSYDDIVAGLGKMVMSGPVGAMASGAADMDSAALAVAAASGEQSPEAVAARNRITDITDNNFDGGFHDSRIPENMFDNVRAEDPDELYRKAQSIDVGTMTTLQQMWQARATKLETGLAEFKPAVLAAMAESWTGAAASAAASGITDYVAKAQNLVSSSKIMADKVGLVASAVEVTKQNVQPAPDTGFASTVASWVPGPSWKMDSDRSSAAELATYSVLEKVYQPGIREGDAAQPRIPLAYNPVHEPGGAPGPGPSTPGAPSGPGGQAPSAPETSPPATPPENAEQPPGTPETNEPQSQQPQQDSNTPATAPSGLDTAPANAPGPTAPGPSTPGSPNGPGAPSTPGGPSGGPPLGGSPGGPGTPPPGQSTPGPGPGGGRPTNAPAAAGATNQARAGAPGMGSAMPGGARGKNDEEQEKQKSAIAETLINQANGEELTGLDPEHRPKTVPPVLGEEP